MKIVIIQRQLLAQTHFDYENCSWTLYVNLCYPRPSMIKIKWKTKNQKEDRSD